MGYLPPAFYEEQKRGRAQAKALRSLRPDQVRVDTWLGGYRFLFPDGRSDATKWNEAHKVIKFRRAYGDRVLGSITPIEAQAWALDHPTSVHFLRTAWDYAVRMRVVEFNYWRLVLMPKRDKPNRTPPTEAQLEAMLKECCNHHWGRWFSNMILVAAYSGARRGGLLKVRKADVDLPNKRMAVTEKGDKTRTLVLGGRALAAMQSQFAYRDKHGWAGATRRPTGYGKPSPLVFVKSEAPKRRHGAVTPKDVEVNWQTVRGEFPHGFHSLKHYAVTWLAAQGADILDIAVQMGHTDSEGRPRTVDIERRYNHPDEGVALERIASVFVEAP